jgi:hypothetical protein
LIGLNRSTYYLPPAVESAENLRLMSSIDEQYLKTPFSGRRRMTASLQRSGEVVNVKRVGRLMRLMGLEGLHPRRRTTVADPDARAYPYLLRDRTLVRPDELWSSEIVHSQMTKPAGLAGRPDRERITDLDVVPGHHDPVDEQLDQLPLPLECRRVETHPHALGERAGRVRAPAQLGRSAHFAREQPLLGRPRLVAALQLRSPTLILTQRDDPAQVGLGQPLDLLGHARSPSPKVFATRLQFLGQPAPAGRPTQRLGHPIRVL